MEATPRPWHVDERSFRDTDGYIKIGSERDAYALAYTLVSDMRGEAIVNAEHIVKCVNAHDTLLHIVKECCKLTALPLAVREAIDAVLRDPKTLL